MRRLAIVLGGLILPALLDASAKAGSGLEFAGPQNVLISDAVNFIYDPADGSLWMQGLSVTTIEWKSADSTIVPEGFAPACAGLLVCASPRNFFNLSPDGYGLEPFFWGTVLPPGLSAQEILDDTDLAGSKIGGGILAEAAGGGPWLHVVPEPSSTVLLGLGVFGLMGVRRKRSKSLLETSGWQPEHDQPVSLHFMRRDAASCPFDARPETDISAKIRQRISTCLHRPA